MKKVLTNARFLLEKCVGCKTCTHVCPTKAYTPSLETNPFPGTTGRVCHHPCEQDCNRMKFDESVSIRSLERFVADYAMEKGYEPAKPEVIRKSAVAVI